MCQPWRKSCYSPNIPPCLGTCPPSAQNAQTPTCLARLHPSVLAQPLSLLVRHIDVVEATEEGGQDDHEDEHEPGQGRDGEGSEQVSTLGELRL